MESKLVRLLKEAHEKLREARSELSTRQPGEYPYVEGGICDAILVVEQSMTLITLKNEIGNN